MKGGIGIPEKRFDYIENRNICVFRENKVGLTNDEVCDLLNLLSKENQQLSKLNGILEGFLLDKGFDFNDIIKFLQERTEE